MGLAAIGIVANDVAKSLKFYALLGVNFKQFQQTEHFDSLQESGINIMLDSAHSIKQLYPDWKKSVGSTPIVLCFEQSSAKAVDEAVAQVKAQGFQIMKEPWDAFWGQRYASVLDPDGNQIDIFAKL